MDPTLQHIIDNRAALLAADPDGGFQRWQSARKAVEEAKGLPSMSNSPADRQRLWAHRRQHWIRSNRCHRSFWKK